MEQMCSTHLFFRIIVLKGMRCNDHSLTQILVQIGSKVVQFILKALTQIFHFQKRIIKKWSGVQTKIYM